MYSIKKLLPGSKVWYLAWPMILSNITIPLFGLVDTAVVGHLQHAYYLGAVGIGTLIFNFLYFSCNFLRMGTTGLIAQAHGSQNNNGIRTILLQASLIALALGLLMLLLQHFIIHIALTLIHPSAQLEFYSRQYFFYRIWAAPAALLNFVIMGWFIGMQNTRMPLIQLTLVNTIGISLDFILVFGFGLDIRGVAIANAIAQYLGLFLGIYLVAYLLKRHPGQWLWRAIFAKKDFCQLTTINRDIFIRTLSLMLAFALFTRQSTQLGKNILAANVVLLNFQSIMAFALDGFANAAEALVGRAFGKQDLSAFKQAIKSAAQWSFYVALLLALLYLLFGKTFINLMTSLATVRETAYVYLPWVIISPLISVWGYLYDGIFIGAIWARAMRNTMLLAVGSFLLAWLSLRSLGNNGLWLALLCFMAIRGISMALVLHYFGKKGIISANSG